MCWINRLENKYGVDSLMINKDKRADLRPKKLKQGLYLCS